MQLCVGPWHVVSAEIAVAMAMQIQNPTDCEVRGVIRSLEAEELFGWLSCPRGKLSRGIDLLHGNARSHASRQTQVFLSEQFHWDIFEHPPYSPDLASSDFFLFSKMKEHLAGKHFTNDEDLKDAG